MAVPWRWLQGGNVLWGYAMQHPFSGLIQSEKPANELEPVANPSRRGLFGLVAGTLAAGTVALIGLTSSAEAQRAITTLAIGEEGGRPRPPSGGPTTRMLGEEGSGRRRMKK
jgi:hypothetical protein